MISTENYKQHMIVAVVLSLLYSGEIKELKQCKDLSIVRLFCSKRVLGTVQHGWRVNGQEKKLHQGVRRMSGVNVTGECSTEYIQFSIATIINQTVTATVKCSYKYLK